MINVQLYQEHEELVEVEFRSSNHRYKVNGSYVVGVSTILGTLSKDLMGWAAMMAADYFKEKVEPYVMSEKKMTKMALTALTKDARKAHQTKSQRGKDVGTIAHNWIEEETAVGHAVSKPQYVQELLANYEGLDLASGSAEIQTSLDEIQAIKDNAIAAQHCVQQWRQWMIDYDIELVKSEFIVYSKKLDYCGTVDTIFRSKSTGKLYIGDYKTSEPMKIRNHKYVVTGHQAYPEHFAQISAYDYAYSEETAFLPDAYAVLYLPKEGNYQMFVREQVEHDRQGWEHLVHVYRWITGVRKDG